MSSYIRTENTPTWVDLMVALCSLFSSEDEDPSETLSTRFIRGIDNLFHTTAVEEMSSTAEALAHQCFRLTSRRSGIVDHRGSRASVTSVNTMALAA